MIWTPSHPLLRFFITINIALLILSESLLSSPPSNSTTPPDPFRPLCTIARNIPQPHPDHPGNIYLQDEQLIVKVPENLPSSVSHWQALTDTGNVIAQGDLDAKDKAAPLKLGQPGIGWYRIEFLDTDNNCQAWTTAAVLARLRAPTPQDSPVCLDSATAWFGHSNPARQEYFTRLAALAGVNWIRDRMRWGTLQPQKNKFAQNTTYDSSVTFQAKLGLKVLQVFHDTPAWAVDKNLDPCRPVKRFPRNLCHLFEFCRALAHRYPGRVLAWEPWNEANITGFGGHTIDEICTFQKAAYLGFKAGDPDLIVGWNAYCWKPTQLHTDGVLANETWPYFDTYNIHSYDWPYTYLKLWEPVRSAACGRPIWVTEADRGMITKEPPPWYDLTRKAEIQKAHILAQEYTYSLFAGANRHFHFILGNYHEDHNSVQFGLLRRDFTPRPAYVALAAVGRFLAGARPLGCWSVKDKPHAHIYAFRAQPDGCPQDVLIAWAEKEGEWPQRGQTSVEWSLPSDLKINQVYDYLGRSLGNQSPGKLNAAPIFLLLPPGQTQTLPLKPPAQPCPYRTGSPSPVVLQLQLPQKNNVSSDQSKRSPNFIYALAPDQDQELSFFAYNFSNQPLQGTISVEKIPASWKLTPAQWSLSLDPLQRQKFTGRILIPSTSAEAQKGSWIKLRGNFKNLANPVLSFYVKAAKINAK